MIFPRLFAGAASPACALALSALPAFAPAFAQSYAQTEAPLGAAVDGLLAAGRSLSPSLRAAALDTDAASARAEGAGALDDPGITDSYTYYKDPNVFSAHTVMLTQAFPLWGKRGLRREAALAEVDASRGRARAAQDALDEAIKVAYARYYLTARDRAVNREIAGLAHRMRAAASARYGQGGGDQLAVIQALGEETAARTEDVRLAGEQEAARARLNVLIGRPAGAPLADPVRPRPVPAAEPALDVLVDRARAANPTLAAGAATIDAARTRSRLAEKAWYPDVTLGAGPLIQTNNRPIGFAATVGLNIPLPWGHEAAGQREAQAQLGASQQRYDAARLEIEGALAESLAKFRAARATEALLRTEAMPQARAAFQTVLAGYSQGRGDLAGETLDQLIAKMNAALQLPGVSNAWTMPIKARIDMLSTGIRTPVGVKIFGPDLHVLERLATEVERVVHGVPGTTSAFAERLEGGHYVEIVPDREAAARYGLSVADVQKVVAAALGGETVTTTVEGRERYGVNLRYPRSLREDPDAIASQVLVPAMGGAMVPLGQVASIHVTTGPPSIRTENAQPVAYIYIDLQGRDLGGYVAEAAARVAGQVNMPPGYHIAWSGQFEYLQRAEARLALVVPATLVVILVLLFLNFGRLTESFIVMLSVPFALVGGAWLMWWLGYNMSVAVAVGFIALAGVAAETGVVMLIYLDHAVAEVREQRRLDGAVLSREDVQAAIMRGAVERVRPKMMTVVAIMAGLLPILWSTGTGSEFMRRIAVPMVGGMLSSTVLTLLVIPAIYAIVKGWRLPHQAEARAVRLGGQFEPRGGRATYSSSREKKKKGPLF